MCAVRESINNFSIDERNLRFGEHALLLTKPQEFINRIIEYTKQLKIKSDANLVEYVDNDYRGEVGPFRKLKPFAYQSEWRVVCYNGLGGIRKLQIGSIKEISRIVPSSEINQILSSI